MAKRQEIPLPVLLLTIILIAAVVYLITNMIGCASVEQEPVLYQGSIEYLGAGDELGRELMLHQYAREGNYRAFKELHK